MTWIRMLNNFSLVSLNTTGLLKELVKKKPTLPTQNGRMGSESIAHEAAIDSVAMRARGIIVLVKSN